MNDPFTRAFETRIVHGQPFADYRKATGYNQSTLKAGRRGNWAAVKYSLDGGAQEDTDARVEGRLTHCAMLTPELLDTEFHLCEPRERKQPDGREWVSHSIHNRVFAHTNALAKNEMLMGLLNGTQREISLYWVCEETGLNLKGRIDAFHPEQKYILDLKTTAKGADPMGCARTIASLGYAGQAAWYMEGLRANGFDVEQFIFAFLEKKAPYAVGLYRLNAEDLLRAHAENKELLARLQVCLKKGEWPAYYNEIVDLKIPEEFYTTMESYDGLEA